MIYIDLAGVKIVAAPRFATQVSLYPLHEERIGFGGTKAPHPAAQATAETHPLYQWRQSRH
jgi:hypothetical protein